MYNMLIENKLKRALLSSDDELEIYLGDVSIKDFRKDFDKMMMEYVGNK